MFKPLNYGDTYEKVIAIKEKSAGNDTVGDMWLETCSFSKDTPISEILYWARDTCGKLIITIDQSTITLDKISKSI